MKDQGAEIPKDLERLKLQFETDNQDNKAEGLAMISSHTRESLLLELELNPSDRFADRFVVAGFPVHRSFMIAVKEAVETSKYFYEHAEGFMNATQGWVDNNFSENPLFAQCAAAGAGLVLKALRLEMGPRFTDRLTQINPGDFMSAYGDFRKPISERYSVFDRAKSKAVIPDYQFNLLFCRDRLAEVAPDYILTQDGANTVYQVISSLWEPKRNRFL